MQALRQRLRTALGLQPGDMRRVAPVAAAYALTLTIIYILKPARNALFLDNLGVERLPYVLLLVALVGGVAALGYGRIAARVRTDLLVPRTLAALGVFLLAFRWVISVDKGGALFAFFVFVQIFGLISTSLVWLWANSAFEPREARRLFGLIGTGGILGSIVGGLLTGEIASRVGTPNLLIVAAVGMLGVLACLRVAPVGRPPAAAERRRPNREKFDPNRLPLLLAANAALVAVVAVFVDVQFNAIVEDGIPDADGKAAFFGRFFAAMSSFSLGFQLLATPWVLRRFGVGAALGVLPTAVAGGALVFGAFPGFVTGILPKAADGGFRHSVHKAASEVVFLPVPSELKKRAKLFIDTAIDTGATGVGAVIVLLTTGPIGMSYRSLMIPTAALAAIGVWFGFRLRRAYVDAFRRAIETRRLDLGDITTGMNEAAILDMVMAALRSSNPRQVAYGLDLAASISAPALREPLAELLEHPTRYVRRRALEVLGHQSEALPPETLEALYQRDEDIDVRSEALSRLIDLNAASPREVASLFDGDDTNQKVVALKALRLSHSPDLSTILEDSRVRALRSLPSRVRAELAHLLPLSPKPEHRATCLELVEEGPLAVRVAAVEGMGQSSDPEHLPFLVDALSRRDLRGPARTALARFGDAGASAVSPLLEDPTTPLQLRRAAIRVLAEVASPNSVRRLIDVSFRQPEPLVAREAIERLVRLRRQGISVPVPRRLAIRAVKDRLTLMALVQRTLGTLEGVRGEGPELFARAVRERWSSALDEIFQVLALIHPPEAMLDAQRNLSGTAQARGNALEYLEYTLHRKIGAPLAELVDAGAIPTPPGREDVFAKWSNASDPWMRACALFARATIDGSLPPEDPHPLVAQTRQHVLSMQERT